MIALFTVRSQRDHNGGSTEGSGAWRALGRGSAVHLAARQDGGRRAGSRLGPGVGLALALAACTGPATSSGGACAPDPRCASVGLQCSADAASALECAADEVGCVRVTGETACGAGQRCAGAPAACAPGSTLAIAAPAPGALVGLAGTPVAVKLTLTDGATPPATVTLRDAYQDVLTLSRPARDGAIVTWSGTYLPPRGLDGAVSLRAVAGADAVPSPAVEVLVDTRAPAVSDVAASCDLPGCPRDAVVTISAALGETRLARAEGWLVLDPTDPATATARVALAPNPATGRYEGRLRLADVPFPALERPAATPHASAIDAAGNASPEVVGPPRPLTRLRHAPIDLGEAVTGPAVDGAGRLLMGGASGVAVELTPDAAGAYAVAKTPLGLGGIAAAPAVGADGAWFTSATTQAAALLAPGGTAASWSCPANGSRPGLQAATVPGGGAWAVAGGPYSKSQQVDALSAAQACQASAVGPQLATPFVALGGKLFAATRGSSPSLARFSLDPATGAVGDDGWRASLVGGALGCDAVAAPLAVDAFGHLVVVCRNGQLWCVDRGGSGQAIYLHTFGGASGGIGGSPLGLATREVVLAVNGSLRKYSLTLFRELAFTPANGSVTGYLATRADAAGVVLYAVTDAGGLYALDDGLGVVWSAALGTAPLGEPTVAPAGGGALPTLYVPAADGKLYAVVVDAPLDDASPWPKARHDAGNTGDAGL